MTQVVHVRMLKAQMSSTILIQIFYEGRYIDPRHLYQVGHPRFRIRRPVVRETDRITLRSKKDQLVLRAFAKFVMD